jgi:hypothetical protein
MHSSDANSVVEATSYTQEEIGRDLLRLHASNAERSRRLVMILGGLFLVGVLGFILKALEGFDDRSEWAYYSLLVAYLMITAQTVPLVAVALRLTKAHFRRPFTRIAELFAAVGFYNLILMIPLFFLLPSAEGRRSFWFFGLYREGWPPGAPALYVVITVVILVLSGLALMYFASLPDLSAMRDGNRGKWYHRLAPSWQGTRFQWRILFTGLGFLGAFYFLMIIFTHTIWSMDFGESLIPGWKDSIFPTAQALHAIQCSVALLLLTMYILRRWGGYQAYLGVDQFWGLSKLLLASSLMWFYFWFAGLITFWYGRQPAEILTLRTLMFESYLIPFLLAFFMCFLIPVVLLIWNWIRKSITMLAVVASIVLIGNFFEALRVYVTAFSIDDVTVHALTYAPAAQLPNITDIMVVIGGLSGAALVYLLTMRIIPAVSIWEMRELILLRRVRNLVRLPIISLGKPE